eukprot:6209418-Pleurochrysis_carterae.AAC.2
MVAPTMVETSAFTPLLKHLHQEVVEFSTAARRLQLMRSKYHSSAFDVAVPEDVELKHRGNVAACQSVRRHILDVKRRQQLDYVLLPRHACSEGNVLYRVPAAQHAQQNPRPAICTASPIISNSASLRLEFLHAPSAEVMIHSPILKHASRERTTHSGGYVPRSLPTQRVM